MYTQLLPYLRCPACGAEPTLHATETNAGDVIVGVVACAACQKYYPIRNGIADFLGEAHPPTPAQRVNEWRLTAWAYERVWRPFALTLLAGERFPLRRELPLMAELVAARHGGLFVDVACSNGLYARALARVAPRRTSQIVGVDHSWAMLVEARRRALAAGLLISYVRAEAQALPFASGAAAGVVVGGSLNEIGDLDQCLSEAQRVLAPQGRVVTMSLVRAQSRVGRTVQRALGGGGVVFAPADALIEHFTRAGLRTVGVWRYRVVIFTQSILRDEL